MLVPAHCTGWKAQHRIAAALPERVRAQRGGHRVHLRRVRGLVRRPLASLRLRIRPWPQCGMRKRGSGQSCDAAAVALDGAEAGVVVLPHPGGRWAMSSWLRSDEVLHSMTSCSANGGPPSRTARARASGAVLRCQRPLAGALERQFPRLRVGPAYVEGPRSRSTPCSKAGSTSRVGRRRGQIDLRAEQGCVGGYRGPTIRKLAQEHPKDGAGDGKGLGRVVGEVAAGVTIGVGQRHPQLNAVQNGRRRRWRPPSGRCLRPPSSGSVRRVAPGRAPRRCRGAPFAFEQPADGLESGVRMRRDVHPDAAHLVRPVVVGETPRPDQRPLPLWQRAAHADGPRTAQRHFPRMQHTGECRCRASHFGRRGIGVAHVLTVAPSDRMQT